MSRAANLEPRWALAFSIYSIFEGSTEIWVLKRVPDNITTKLND